MSRSWQFSIARLMGVVLFLAIGMAALRYPSEAWAGGMLLLTVGLLMIATVGAVCRGPDERAWWLGFLLFGVGYLALVQWYASDSDRLPTTGLAGLLMEGLGLHPLSGLRLRWRDQNWAALPAPHRIVHCLWAVAFAFIGSVLATVFVVGSTVRSPTADEPEPSSLPPARPWRMRTPLIGLSGFWIVAIAASLGRWQGVGIWAGLSFLLACSLLGFAALGAAFGRGRDRAICLGAALFGFGYLVLTFGKSDWLIVEPHLPTEGWINGLPRPGGPPIMAGFPDFNTWDNRRIQDEMIRRKLDQPIAMHFPAEPTLGKVLDYIKQLTKDKNFNGIPIYVNPEGLQKAERTMDSTVVIDQDPIPVKDALREILRQLGLSFSVRDGFLMISDPETATLPVYEDPVQVVGHSFLSLVAAAIGGLAGAYLARRSPGADPSAS